MMIYPAPDPNFGHDRSCAGEPGRRRAQIGELMLITIYKFKASPLLWQLFLPTATWPIGRLLLRLQADGVLRCGATLCRPV